jgi:putative SOS response-associated peptidase YedK
MCGRFQLKTSAAEIASLVNVRGPLPNFPPTWNAAPTQSLPVVRSNPETNERQLDLLRWGLVPVWSKDLATGFKAINARAETVATSGLFRDAFKSRRCLVPADGFYEWQKIDGGKQPYSFAMTDRQPFAFAGLWDRWKNPDGEWIRSFTIITGAANALVAPVHNRMPVILSADDHAVWLGETETSPDALLSLLKPFPAEKMCAWRVGHEVGNVRNNHAGLAEEVNSA